MTAGSTESLLPLRLKELAKLLGLKMLTICKPILPKSFTSCMFSSLTNIRLEFKDEEKEREITICKYKHGAKGALCLSLDFDPPPSHQAKTNWQEAITKILQLTEKHKIPMSWGICGMFALSESNTFKQIIASVIPHDLGAHTFTHVDLSSTTCTDDIARDEILQCIEVVKKAKSPVTFVFPWNREGHLLLLKEYGFITYRGNKTAKLAYPSKTQQLWDIHQTYFLTEKSAREVNVILTLIDSAISYGHVLHIWSHPWNISIDQNVGRFIEKVMDPLLSYAARKRSHGSLWVCTMRELSNYCEAREACRIERINKTKDKISFSVHCMINDQRFDFPPTVTLRIPVPRRWKEIKALVDHREQEFGSSCFVAKHGWKLYLLLTLCFENPSREVCLIKAV